MINVFLVEDEKRIREGIKKRIDWGQHGLCLVGEAGDGEIAYPMIQEAKPDILITDVMMPFMNGLELSELVKRELPDIKIIIISGFEHFAYASRALKIGVTEYLMKPVSATKLLGALSDAKKEILENREQKKYVEVIEKELAEKEQMKRYRFMGELISGRCSVSEVYTQGKKLQLDLAAKAYNLILFQYWKEETGGQRDTIQDERVEHSLSKLWESHEEAIYFDRGTEGGVLLIKGGSKRELTSQVKALVNQLSQVFREADGIRYFIGVGKEIERLRDIPQCYHEANKAFAGRFFSKLSCVVFSSGMKKVQLEEKMQGSGEEMDLRGIDKEQMENFLRNGSRSNIKVFVDEFYERIGWKNMRSLILRQYILIDSSFAAIHFVERIGGDKEQLETELSNTERISSSVVSDELTKQYLVRLLDLSIGIRDGISGNNSNRLVESGKEYIRKHFGDEDISLNTVAAYVNVSPNYFSRVFRQQEGKTFVEYLTDIRLNQAKEMLCCTGLKASEISRRLGYKDPHYFYYLFKKTVGCTPGDYRMRSVV